MLLSSFHCFFDLEFFINITNFTNENARRYIQGLSNLKPNSRIRRWPANGILVLERKGYIAILMAMGINEQPSYKGYWSQNGWLKNRGISDILSRDLFMLINKFSVFIRL